MKLSLQLGSLALSLGAERSYARNLRRSFGPIQSWLRGDDVTAANAALISPFQQSVWVYTVISALAQTVSAIPFRISRGDRSGETLVTKGPIIDLFNRPHEYLNRFRFWEFIVTWYCLRGEVFFVALDRQGQILPIKSQIFWIIPQSTIANRKSQISWFFLPTNSATSSTATTSRAGSFIPHRFPDHCRRNF